MKPKVKLLAVPIVGITMSMVALSEVKAESIINTEGDFNNIKSEYDLDKVLNDDLQDNNSFESLAVNNEVTDDTVQEAKPSYKKFLQVTENNQPVTEELTFEISDAKKTENYITDEYGEISPRFTIDEEYTIELKENSIYKMEPINSRFENKNGLTELFNIENNKPILFLEVEKNEPPKTSRVYWPVLSNGSEVKEPLNFILKSNQNSYPLVSSEGQLPLRLVENNKYTIELGPHEKYMMEPISFNFKNKDGFLNAFEISDDKLVLALKVSEKNRKNKEPNSNIIPDNPRSARVFWPVLNEGVEISQPLNFILSSNLGEEVITSSDGQISLKLKEGYQYVINLEENQKYLMEPIVFEFKEVNGVLNAYRIQDNKLVLAMNLNQEEKDPGTESSQSKKTRLYLPILLDGKRLLNSLQFELSDGLNTEKIQSNNGEIELFVNNNKPYSVRIVENDDYQMGEKYFKIQNLGGSLHPMDQDGNLIVALNLVKSSDVKDLFEEEQLESENALKETVTIKPLKVIDGTNKTEEKIKMELTFNFFNVSTQENYGEFTTINGQLPEIKLISDHVYTVTLNENPLYKMPKRQLFAFLNHYPIDFNDEYGRYFETLVVEKKDNPDEQATFDARITVALPITLEGELYTDSADFKLISAIETLSLSSENGIIKLPLLEDIDYMIVLNHDRYDVELFPIVIKDKGLYGKFAYDHRNCDLVQRIELIPKGEAEKNNTSLYCQTHGVRVSGMNFSELKLEVEKIDSKGFEKLQNKDVDLYDIKFINIYRDEIVKLHGDFVVEISIPSDKKVSKVFEISSEGDLNFVDFIENDSNVIFKTNQFSIYGIEYENIQVELNEDAKTEGSSSPEGSEESDEETSTPETPQEGEVESDDSEDMPEVPRPETPSDGDEGSDSPEESDEETSTPEAPQEGEEESDDSEDTPAVPRPETPSDGEGSDSSEESDEETSTPETPQEREAESDDSEDTPAVPRPQTPQERPSNQSSEGSNEETGGGKADQPQSSPETGDEGSSSTAEVTENTVDWIPIPLDGGRTAFAEQVSGGQLLIEGVNNQSELLNQARSLLNDSADFDLYNIEFVDQNNNEVNLGQSIKFRLPYDPNKNVARVVYLGDHFEVVRNIDFKDNKAESFVEISHDSFSYFAVVYEETATQLTANVESSKDGITATNEKNVDNYQTMTSQHNSKASTDTELPQTGAGSAAVIVGTNSILVGLGLGLLGKKRD